MSAAPAAGSPHTPQPRRQGRPAGRHGWGQGTLGPGAFHQDAGTPVAPCPDAPTRQDRARTERPVRWGQGAGTAKLHSDESSLAWVNLLPNFSTWASIQTSEDSGSSLLSHDKNFALPMCPTPVPPGLGDLQAYLLPDSPQIVASSLPQEGAEFPSSISHRPPKVGVSHPARPAHGADTQRERRLASRWWETSLPSESAQLCSETREFRSEKPLEIVTCISAGQLRPRHGGGTFRGIKGYLDCCVGFWG